VSEHIEGVDVVVSILKPFASGEIDCDRQFLVNFGDVVYNIEGHQLVVFVGVYG
jgi:hypothetical protein